MTHSGADSGGSGWQWTPDDEALPGAVAETEGPPFDFEERVRSAPDRPGVYLMKDRQGHLVYIGKAASLRNRLRQYLLGQDGRFFVHLLHDVLGDIEFVLTTTEKDALLLENALVKQHQPRFNVKLKDDKRFLHLRIDTDSDYPRLEVVRRPANDKALYFGPYASASAARATLALVNRHFQLRTCPDAIFRNRTRPCLEYQIHRCPGPCTLPVDPKDYAGHVKDVALFLSGHRRELADRVQKRMAETAADEDFERAARYRDLAKAVESSLETQHISLLGHRQSIDALGLYREGARVAMAVLSFRDGVLLGSQGYVLKDQEWADADVVEGFATQLYDRGQGVPDEVLTPVALEGAEVLGDWLSDLRRTRAHLEGGPVQRAQVQVRCPQRGLMVRLCEMAAENAKQLFEDRLRASASIQATLEGLQKRLRLTNLPRRIECYDISNIQAADTVGSMVVFLDGEPAPAEYRVFSIQHRETPNDFASMYEVLDRRFQRARSDGGPLPDLVVIDGGRGQLKMAEQVLADQGVYEVELCSLAKARTVESDDRGSSRHSDERVFRPGIKNPVIPPQNSNEIYLLARIRDEAHRFAIGHHRKRRNARTLTSTLDRIPGVGPARKKALLRVFGSLKALAAAEEAAIAAVPGVGAEVARRVRSALNRPDMEIR